MIEKSINKKASIKRLKELSDDVRRGTPITMSEVMEVIEYQEMLKKNKLSITDRILKFFKTKQHEPKRKGYNNL